MNKSNTPKVVVGVGLVAVYAVGLTVLTLREKHEVVQSPPAEVAAATPEVASPAVSPLSETTAEVAQAPAVTATAPSPVTPEPKARADASIPADVAATSPSPRGTDEAANAGNIASEAASDSVAAPAAASNAAATASPGKDSQITADVKSKVEAVAPGGAIDVTTRDGVVELAGSVPSQDALEKARMAANSVRDVRDVDVSALTISN
jgi:hyperosmotically inducible protein